MSAASSHTELNPAAAAHSTLELIWLPLIGLAFVFVLAFTNLVDFPLTWFDEGSHLHVPKTLVRFGVYADYSRDGFRYFGPTIGVGPTVMLPIAAAFKLFGIGLFQARVIMALYLVGAVIVFYGLARLLGGPRLALVATALLVVTPGLGLVEYGRQVLGEVPGLLFTLAGFWVWFKAWDSASLRRLTIVGLFFGLAVVTKNQYLLVLAPT
ncbi:MAG TPA: glycosyltransferase family 39 protein, partial [Anaerolineales bacterium]|nr:glycosyltransferase family 39 protein [Anaerolineales bacterium]